MIILICQLLIYTDLWIQLVVVEVVGSGTVVGIVGSSSEKVSSCDKSYGGRIGTIGTRYSTVKYNTKWKAGSDEPATGIVSVNLIIAGPGNDLFLVRRQVISQINADSLSIGHIWPNFSELGIKIPC